MNGLWILAAIGKWVGIALLAVLLLLLLVVLLALFLPVSYQAEAKKETDFSAAFGVSLFLGAVRCRGGFDPENGLKLRLKALWLTLLDGGPKEEKPKKEKKTKKKKEKAARDEPAAPQPVTAREKAGSEEPPEPEKPSEPPKAQRVKRQEKVVRRVRLEEIAEPVPPPEPEFPEEGEAFFTGEDFEEEPKKRIPPIVSEVIHMEGKKEILSALGRLLKRLLKGVLPGELFVKGTFGTGDPTTTGYLLAAAGVLTARFGDDIRIKGDFSKAGAEDVEVRIKGRIIPAYLVWAVLAFLLAKSVRRALWRLWKMRKEL